MTNRFSVIASQALIVFNIFVTFLLIFDAQLQPPLWLQSFGRMHPLLLHFPIVLLVLAMIAEFIKPGGRNTERPVKIILHYLLLAGALLAGVTVILGLILSREEGYEGASLLIHKWTGAAIFYFASIVYFTRYTSWYKTTLAKTLAILTTLMLIVAGHYGANLTHGDGFVTQPLAGYVKPRTVRFDQARVFDDVIKPIFERKCISCHNPDKIKGELLLTDSASVMKGGKNGILFTAGEEETSLLLQRLHLPLEDEKHMPPKGKIQLTDGEIRILTAWINNSQTYFSEKVIDLPETDTVRMLAAHLLKPATDDLERYDFSAADAKTVEALNTDYRTILPTHIESPALAVNIYNREAYSVKQIEELEKIKNNIVSLNLNKMPVTDEQLNKVNQFKNLRRLELNFTDVTEKGLDALKNLAYLHTITLSGTKLNFDGLKNRVGQLKQLKTLSVWNSGLTPEQMNSLKQSYQGIYFIEGFKDDGSDTLTLNPPQVKNEELVFGSTTPVELFHPVRGVQIRFTLDGSEPDSLSPIFENKTIIDKRTTVKAKAYKDGWHASESVTFDFLKNSFVPDSVAVLTPFTSVHKAEGPATFFNKKLGAIGANNPAWANFWAGVRHNDMVVLAMFHKPVSISSFGLHYMLEQPTGIYPPAIVEVWGGPNENQLKLLATLKAPLPEKGQLPSLETVEASFKTQEVSCIKVVAKPYAEKERKFLLLVDEMFIN